LNRAGLDESTSIPSREGVVIGKVKAGNRNNKSKADSWHSKVLANVKIVTVKKPNCYDKTLEFDLDGTDNYNYKALVTTNPFLLRLC
jgi:hypothetical protein